MSAAPVPPPLPTPPLQLAGVARKFGADFVLRDVTLTLEAGDLLALYGGNGAGKTTLLRVIAGLLAPSRGEGRVGGYDLRDRRSVREQVFLLEGGGGLYADLTALENLRFTARMYGLSPAETAQRSGAALTDVGLEGAAHKRARELSSGMRKRLGLARLSLCPAPLLLLDEPFANLDQEGREVVLAQLRRLRAQGRTALISSHEPELAGQVATRSATLRAGVLRAEVQA